jgi:SpoVK/Ycf46/Vps4 family AAA+-type ATPase
MLSHIRGATILFDEIDDLLLQRSRNTTERPRFLDLVVPAMLNRLQDLRDACRRQELCFFFGTNYIDNIEPALVRPGRVDRHMAVVYPDHQSRLMLVARHLRPILALEGASAAEKAIASWLDHWCASIAADTAGWSWNDIKRSLKGLGIRQIVQSALEDAMENPTPLPEYTERKPPKRKNMPDTDLLVNRLHETSHRLQEILRVQARQITPPAYRARLSSQAARAELRREYIEFRLSMRTDFRDIDGILKEEASDFTGFGGNTANVVSEFMTELRAHLELRSAFR